MTSTLVIHTPVRIELKVDPFSKPLFKILRLTMYKNMRLVYDPIPLPGGYEIEQWSAEKMRAFGIVLKQAYMYSTDLAVYPELNTNNGCLQMVNDWTELDGFLPGASFIVTKGNEPVGMILSSRTPASVFGQIYVVAVTPNHRKQGIGKHLVRKSMQKFSEIGLIHGTLFLNSMNRRAVRFFKLCGFKVDGKAIYK